MFPPNLFFMQAKMVVRAWHGPCFGPCGRLRCSANFVSWIQKLHGGKSTNFCHNCGRSPSINGKAANALFAIAAYYSLFAQAADSLCSNWCTALYLFVKRRSCQHAKTNTVPLLYDVTLVDGTAACWNGRRMRCGVFFRPRCWAGKSWSRRLVLIYPEPKLCNGKDCAAAIWYDACCWQVLCFSWLTTWALRLEVGASRILIGAAVEGMPLCWRWW